ncbi:MAG: hypothetical protein LJF15_17905 [Acidobacteria bacterium]|jgi:hypothetical protein|nr:hypothetical protein [Acidobacteriota bacterium]
MKKILWMGASALAGAVLVGLAAPVLAQSDFEVLKGKAFDTAVVKDFYLEGNAVPTQKRNAVLIQSTDGKRMLFALLDTSGYGADIQAKYIGMAIVEKPVSIGGVALGVGAYGFGLEKGEREAPGTFQVYDLAGEKVGSGEATYDAALAQPVPLQVVTGAPTRLYLGRYGLDIK